MAIQNNTAYNLLPTSFFKPGTTELKDGIDETTARNVQAGIQAKLDSLPPAMRNDFLQMVADLTPGDVDTPLKLEATLAMYEAALSQLGDSNSGAAVFVGNIARLLARIMIEQTAEQRQNALNDRLAAREQAKADLMGQADKLDEAATKMMEGANTALITGLVAASLQILASAVSLVGSLKALGGMSDAQKATQKTLDDVAGKTLDEAAQKAVDHALQATKQLFDKAGALGGVFTAIGQIGTAAGQGINAAGSSQDAKAQAQAKEMEAEGSRNAAEAQESQQTADNKKQIEEALNDMMKQIINFLKELREAEVDAMRSLTRV